MKKPMILRKYLLISLSLIILGTICLISGISLGGSAKALEITRNNYSWWPSEHFTMGIFGLTNSDEKLKIDTGLDNINAISIENLPGKISIVRGSKNMIETSGFNRTDLVITNNNNLLQIDGNNLDNRINFGVHFNNIYEKAKTVITLIDKVYDQVKIDANIGDLDIQDLKTKSLECEVELGSTKMRNIYSEGTNINNSLGDIDMRGIFLGRVEIDNDLGSTTMLIQGRKSEYSYDLDCELGDIRVDGESVNSKHGISDNIQSQRDPLNQNGLNYIEISNSLGEISLSFTDK